MSGGGGSDSSPGSSDSNPAAAARSVVLSELLGHIHGYYKAALDRLPVEEMPALIPRLLDAGVGFGLLDPVSNIIANTVSCEPLPEPSAARGKEEEVKMRRGRKRKRNKKKAADEARRRRDAAMSEIITDASSISCLSPILDGNGTSERTVAQRSLHGLVTFLVSYFRHLTVSEALHYLRLAKADLLVAVQLIERGRGTAGGLSVICSPTTEIALRCAAMSASHPKPAILAARSLSLALHLDELSQFLITERCLSPDAISRLHKLLEEPFEQLADSQKPVRLATLRLHRYIKNNKGANSSLNKLPLGFTESLRSLLLEKIHGLYLKAIAQLPRDALRRRHHRGLLKAGHCFGPADDPVSNIILNTIWYDTAFPPQEEFKVDMICTNSLVRIECRSLNGLLAFLHTLFPTLSEHDAMFYLFQSNASLQEVIFKAIQDHDTSSSYEDAYKAAADAAQHPDPDAQAEFAMSTRPMLLPTLWSLQGVSRTLTCREVEPISGYFSQKSSPSKSVPRVPELTPRAFQIVSHHQRKFMANQCFIRRKVKAALQKYGQQKGTDYELHVICGMNAKVPENGRHGYFRNRRGFPYSHVNFLVRPKGSHSDDTASMLFFLECSNAKEGVDRLSLCCTVLESTTDAGRCFHCEYHGTKIVHPAFETYRGRETDFEEMACGERGIKSDSLIRFGKLGTEFVDVLHEDDSIYFDPARDSDFTQYMKELCRAEEETEELFRREGGGR